MRISSPRLRRLDGALANLPEESEAMLLSDLDGYLAGVIVCPDQVLPDEWLPLVWSADGTATPFVDDDEARWYAELVLDHHDRLRQALDTGRHAPFFEIDARHDEVMWELWIEGFAAAVNLRPLAWGAIAESGDAEAVAAMAGMDTLVRIARDECDLDRAEIDRLTLEAPALIPEWTLRLNAWRREHRGAAAGSADTPRPTKIGRNDPCTCGSGKKYKKCCGAG
ncbi:UPF0149 family protein [Novosphingobium sp. JCM 18896]|uniref:UPF0149 family protein n=1 Tax=Novosphingobium sp. JCM 18896 TaxID=2989731 RepID=UPI002222B4EE|nr:UPF0149 family protein [Novosphingobium sp. JCM 18896]MCW1430591.1 UPF0149 family protein [Novosphingobium sp. JCM 18896]